ncbi:MAG: (R)-stereoselective amidase [Firmicutes bacterium ADurb.Bin373]|nr:MAG: (R)-stereoselective amidase [Firmicutes bacterium ADurb.Bin373]
MRLALLHFNLSSGPQEANLALLRRAFALAAAEGADWIITPEMALQGYFFAEKTETLNIDIQPEQLLAPINRLIARYRLTLFLGCAEQDAATGNYYNSCLVIGPAGSVLGRQRKTRSHKMGPESWVTEGDKLEPVSCPGMKAGILVCADSWFVDKARTLKDKGAEVLVAPAAWPPGEHGPGDCWERCSHATGLPVWVCNQTGNQEKLDLSQAQSVVVDGGKTLFSYSGLQQAVLLFDWDNHRRSVVSKQFKVIEVK